MVVPVDINVFALSEMLQWLWRGCIRKGEPMVVAVGSKKDVYVILKLVK